MNKMANADISITEREIKHKAISTEIAAEGIVLLENNGALPFSKEVETIALFGGGARRTVKGGTGSGDVNTRDYVTVEQGLENAGYRIATKAWLSEHEKTMLEAKKAYDEHIDQLSEQGIAVAMLTMMGYPFKEPEFRKIEDKDCAPADAAIYVVSRNSGEGADRKYEEGDYLLSDSEISDISLLSKKYKKFVLLLNVGAPIEIEAVKALADATVLISQGGSGCGDAVAQILCGNKTPSGKLSTTWAKHYFDYPYAEEYTKDFNNAVYKEGIFVGYKWFDLCGTEPLYPFGYGLSYTDFEIKNVSVSLQGTSLSVDVSVANVGTRYGKEVLQLYVTPPQGKLIKPHQVLAGFAKTKLLAPYECANVNITFDITSIASYDESISSWILESGEYILRLGSDSRNARPISAVVLEKTCTTEVCGPLMRSQKVECDFAVWNNCAESDMQRLYINGDSICKKVNTYAEVCSELPKSERNVSFDDCLKGSATAEELVAQMSTQELILLCVGGARVNFTDFSVIGNASSSIPGAAGDTTSALKHCGIPACSMADGPAGIRVNPKVYQRGDKYINNVAEDPLLGNVIPKEFRKVDLSGTQVKYQFCTALPIATQLAQTWNLDLLEQAGDIVGAELDELGIDLWLAPAMNIHRNPLCGRNFEYFSEDPFLSGKCAAAVVKGVQKHSGKGVTIKHLAANNQETNRNRNSSILSERALREVYLKGFEICVKESQPFAAMTSVNLINGVHTANDKDLLQHILRDEWGFNGIVMTDWGTTGEFVENNGDAYSCSGTKECIFSGNDLIMPGTQADEDRLSNAVKEGTLSVAQLQCCAVRIIKLLLKCATGNESEKEK